MALDLRRGRDNFAVRSGTFRPTAQSLQRYSGLSPCGEETAEEFNPGCRTSRLAWLGPGSDLHSVGTSYPPFRIYT